MRGLNILMIPRIGQVDGGGSLTAVPMTFLSVALGRDKGATATIIAPEHVGDDSWVLNYVDADVAARIRVVKVPVETKDQRLLGYCIGETMLRMANYSRNEFSTFDVIVSNCWASTPAFVTVGEWTHQFQHSARHHTPVVSWGVWNASIGESGRPDPLMKSEYDVMAESLGAQMSDLIVFESTRQYAQYRKLMGRYLVPAAIDRMLNRSVVVPNGADFDAVVMAGARPERAGKTLLWCGRYSEDLQRLAEPMVNLFRAGRVERVLFVSIGGDGDAARIAEFVERLGCAAGELVRSPDRMPQSGVVVMSGLDRAKYFEVCLSSDVIVSDLRGGTYGVRFVEAIAAGVVPIVNEDQIKMFMPPWWTLRSGFVGFGESVIMRAIDFASDPMMEALRQFVAEHHDSKRTMWALYEHLVGVVGHGLREQRFMGLEDAVDGLFDDVDEIALDDAVRIMGAATKSKMDLTLNPIFPPVLVRWLLGRLGFSRVDVARNLYARSR